MDGELNRPPDRRALPPLPADMTDFVAIDMNEMIVYVEPRRSDDILFAAWLNRCRRAGYEFQPRELDLDEIVQMRQTGYVRFAEGTGDVGEVQENREAAIRFLEEAAGFGASDIHLLLRGQHAEVQYRIKGDLRVAARFSQQEGKAVARAYYQGVAVVKDASYAPLEFQNAQISGDVLRPLGLSSVRIVRGPMFPVEDGGEVMVLRLQTGSAAPNPTPGRRVRRLPFPRAPESVGPLTDDGYTESQAERLHFLTSGAGGIVLFTGPVGSGKTTTLYKLEAMQAIEAPERRQITIEKPVEYPKPWAVQLSLTGDHDDGDDEGDAFAAHARHVLRMDPNIVEFAEIRSAGVALTALEAAMTGALVFSTMHTFDPYQVPHRIEIMDKARLPKESFCDPKLIRGIVNQRLVPMLCPHCARALADAPQGYLAPWIRAALPTYGDLSKVRIRGAGCDHCEHHGIVGRVAVAEVIVTDDELMSDFVVGGAALARRNYRARSGADPSVLASAMAHVLAGRADPRDVNKKVDTVVPKGRVNE